MFPVEYRWGRSDKFPAEIERRLCTFTGYRVCTRYIIRAHVSTRTHTMDIPYTYVPRIK